MYFQDNSQLYRVIGRNIKRYRTAAQLAQTQFADKLGISLSYLTKLESAKCDKSLSLSLLNHIANTLNIEITGFFEECD